MLRDDLEQKLRDVYPDDIINLESEVDSFNTFLHIKFNGIGIAKLSLENIQDNIAIYGEDFMENVIFNKVVQDIEEIKENYF